MRMKGNNLILLTIRPEPGGLDHNGAPPEVRLRFILKRLLRQYGWRCVSIGPVTTAGEPGEVNV